MSDELIHKSEMQKWIESKARKPKMSDDLISRQAAIDIVFRSPFFSDSLMEELRALPSVQPKTGRWKEILVHRDDEGDILRDYECTNCLGIICDVPDDDEKELPRFCCMCGAKMGERWSK